MTRTVVHWADYANGNPWLLEQGEDFHTQPHKAAQAARTWASRNGYRCVTELGADSLTVQFLGRVAA